MGSYVSARVQVLAQLKRDFARIGEDYARRILQASNQTIATHTGGPGQALGSGAHEMDLVASGYIASAKSNGYEDARAAANFGNDAKRGNMWAEKAEVKQGQFDVRFSIAYAAGRAGLMHDGYQDPKTDRFMAGVKFLEDAANQEWPGMVEAFGRAVTSLEDIAVKTVAEKRQAKIDRITEAELRAGQLQFESEYSYTGAINPLGLSDEAFERFQGMHYTESQRQKVERTVSYYRPTYINSRGVRVLGGNVSYKRMVLESYEEWVDRIRQLHAMDDGGYSGGA